MTNKEKRSTPSMGAMNWAREIRRAVEARDSVHRAAPRDSVDDALARLRANHAVRTAALGEVSL
ncbi:hypothetical protein [Caballeronia sp. INML2]|uniref:hypothetical protein n=1 Tax=Caballeronia sp. INML2 TaxID=2921748 RepID=UPI0020279BF9|nr:hypothetical protein [Caballeronia sp. INML2]